MLLFSGRPDPEWAVTEDWVARLDEIWRTLDPAPLRSPSAPKLGYRGVELYLDDGASYVAGEGHVTRTRGEASETRIDAGRIFECGVIETAPPEMIPPGAPGLDPP